MEDWKKSLREDDGWVETDQERRLKEKPMRRWWLSGNWPRKEAERKAYEKMMAERKADQERGKAERKA
jgi:hypothetical protein